MGSRSSSPRSLFPGRRSPRLPRRDRWQIIGAILSALRSELSEPETRLSRVASRANLPYDRLQLYLSEMAAMGLITADKPPRMTAEGDRYLLAYQRWVDVLDRFGLD